jgi:hypothetical protein
MKPKSGSFGTATTPNPERHKLMPNKTIAIQHRNQPDGLLVRRSDRRMHRKIPNNERLIQG